MTLPAVTLTQLDGALGVLPPSFGKLLAIAGPSDSGTLSLPVALTRSSDVVSNFGGGPLVEHACYAIENYGRPVLLVKTAATTAGVEGTIDVSGVTGTSVVTLNAGNDPNDSYEIVVLIVTGGTVGTAGITYKESFDGGITYGAETDLGTATTLTTSDTGEAFDLAAGTLVAGDYFGVRTWGPECTASDLTAMGTALASSAQNWELLSLASPVDATIGAALDTLMATLWAAGKYRWWMGSTRTIGTSGAPTEDVATYQAAMAAIRAAYSTSWGCLYSGDCNVLSSVPGRVFNYRRGPSIALAPREMSVSEEIDLAALDLPAGRVPGVSVLDVNGNPLRYDEANTPGLDDLKFATLRTWPSESGVYVTNPRIFSANGSDFEFVPHRRVMNLFAETLASYFRHRLSKPVLVDRTTGFILESEAQEIENGARSLCVAVLEAKPKASGTSVVISRTDNLLSTKTMTVDARTIPLAYPKQINISIGFLNPALQVIPV